MSRPLFLLVVGVLLSGSRDAAAYIDPGSSSYLFQILVAGLTAILFFFSSVKRRVAHAFRIIFRIRPTDAKESPIDPPTPRGV